MTGDLAVLEATGQSYAQNMSGTVTNCGVGSAVGYGGTGYYWPYTPTYMPYPYWPTTYYYSTVISEDKGKKAFDLAQSLVEKKLVEAKSAKQFIELMNAILAVI